MPKQPRVRRVSVEVPNDGGSTSWLRGIRLSGFTLLTLGMLIVAVVALAPSLRVFAEQQKERAQLEEAVRQQQEEVDDLALDVARWDDPSYVEAQARERLYYVKPGEFSFLVVDDGATQDNPTENLVTEDLTTTNVDWVGTLLSSVFIAGLTEVAPEHIVAPEIVEDMQ